MNAKISVFLICVEAVMYLLLYNLHDYTFNNDLHQSYFLQLQQRNWYSRENLF